MRRTTLARATCLALCIGLALLTVVGSGVSAQTFDSVSSRGRSISGFFVITLIASGTVLLLLVGVLAYILIRFRDRPEAEAPHVVRHVHRWQAGWIVGMFLLFTVLGVLMVRVLNVVNAPAASSATTIEVIGHQWWWEFRYPDSGVVTANELHVPADTPIRFEITAADVIHSFWVPEFGWKMDAIPGKTNTMSIEVDQPGTFEGACTEFCGAQHAWMRILVVAETPDQFEGWIAHQQEPASKPQTALARTGEGVFLKNTCISCHAVRFADGSETPGGVGPDLTHVASRETIGSGVLLNTTENLHDWIQNADSVKPGVLMPAFNQLSREELDALVAYLKGLE